MSEGKANPWWLCIRLMWRPRSLPAVAVETPARVVAVIGVTTIYAGWFLAFVGFGLLFFVSWVDWSSALDELAIVTSIGLMIAGIFSLPWLALAILAPTYDRAAHLKAILLAHLPLLLPGTFLFLSMTFFCVDAQIAYASGRSALLDPSIYGLLALFGFLLLAGVYTVVALTGWSKAGRLDMEHRKPTSLCWHCEYDLRGSIPAGATTCPECGEKISPATIATWRDTAPER